MPFYGNGWYTLIEIVLKSQNYLEDQVVHTPYMLLSCVLYGPKMAKLSRLKLSKLYCNVYIHLLDTNF